MTEWKGISIDRSRIVAESARSVKISMPKKGDYKGWYFWHPKKLIFTRNVEHGRVCMRYTDEFVFQLKKDGPKLGTTKEVSISADVMRMELDMYDECIPYIHRPEKLKPVQIEADPELVDND